MPCHKQYSRSTLSLKFLKTFQCTQIHIQRKTWMEMWWTQNPVLFLHFSRLSLFSLAAVDTSKSLEYFGWLTVGICAVSTNFGYSVSTLFLEQEREKYCEQLKVESVDQQRGKLLPLSFLWKMLKKLAVRLRS